MTKYAISGYYSVDVEKKEEGKVVVEEMLNERKSLVEQILSVPVSFKVTETVESAMDTNDDSDKQSYDVHFIGECEVNGEYDDEVAESINHKIEEVLHTGVWFEPWEEWRNNISDNS